MLILVVHLLHGLCQLFVSLQYLALCLAFLTLGSCFVTVCIDLTRHYRWMKCSLGNKLFFFFLISRPTLHRSNVFSYGWFDRIFTWNGNMTANWYFWNSLACARHGSKRAYSISDVREGNWCHADTSERYFRARVWWQLGCLNAHVAIKVSFARAPAALDTWTLFGALSQMLSWVRKWWPLFLVSKVTCLRTLKKWKISENWWATL